MKENDAFDPLKCVLETVESSELATEEDGEDAWKVEAFQVGMSIVESSQDDETMDFDCEDDDIGDDAVVFAVAALNAMRHVRNACRKASGGAHDPAGIIRGLSVFDRLALRSEAYAFVTDWLADNATSAAMWDAPASPLETDDAMQQALADSSAAERALFGSRMARKRWTAADWQAVGCTVTRRDWFLREKPAERTARLAAWNQRSARLWSLNELARARNGDFITNRPSDFWQFGDKLPEEHEPVSESEAYWMGWPEREPLWTAYPEPSETAAVIVQAMTERSEYEPAPASCILRGEDHDDALATHSYDGAALAEAFHLRLNAAWSVRERGIRWTKAEPGSKRRWMATLAAQAPLWDATPGYLRAVSRCIADAFGRRWYDEARFEAYRVKREMEARRARISSAATSALAAMRRR